MTSAHRGGLPSRPAGATDAEVKAAGKISEALEWVERARGHLFTFHQEIGHADFLLDDAIELLEAGGHHDLADLVRLEAVGANVLDGRWTFQIVDEFEQGFYAEVRRVEAQVRDALMDGQRHVFEAELKEARRTRGRPGHELRPNATNDVDAG